jgi:7,8-dihydroneopterin aldolase/epimerase/oxygenase
MIGIVRVRNLEFQGSHGATAAERRSTRRFQVDVDLRVNLARAIETDRLADTINYHEVCALLVEIGESKAHKLLERLAGAMMRAIQTKWPQVTVDIEVRKLHPPCPGNPSHTAVRLSSG